MTLKTICTNALDEIAGVDVPDSFFGSNNITAKLCVALVRREGKYLEKNHSWRELSAEHTFTTVADQSTYGTGAGATDGIPADFSRFANLTQWDRTNFTEMQGPTTPGEWQFLNSSVAATPASITRWFQVRGVNLEIFPTPASTGDTLVYEYYADTWINLISGSGAPAAEFGGDTDTLRINEELVTLGLKWRFLAARGFPFEAEYKEYVDFQQLILGQNGGAGRVNTSSPGVHGSRTNVPETGFGVSP